MQLIKLGKMLILMSIFSLTSTAVLATNDISQDMREIMFNTRQALRADDQTTFVVATDNIIQAAQNSKGQVPPRLASEGKEDVEALQGYQQAIQNLIDDAESARDLAKQGKLEQAKEQLQKLYDLRAMYHPLYK